MTGDLVGLFWDNAKQRYYYRREVTKDLLPFIQKTLWKVSLRTSDRREAVQRYLSEHQKYENLIQEWRTRMSGTHHDDFLTTIALFVSEESSRRGGQLLAMPSDDPQSIHDCWEMYRDWSRRRRQIELGILPDHWEEAVSVLAMYQAARGAYLANVRLLVDQPMPISKPVQTTNGVATMQTSLSEVMEKWLAEVKPSKAVEGDARRFVELFVRTNGNIPIQSIDDPHCIAFKDELTKLPGKASTKNKWGRVIAAVGSYAVENRYVKVNPLRGIKFRVDDDEDKPRPPFTPELINIVLNSEWWKSSTAQHARTMRIAFVIACHQGMRLGEILQLYKDDIITQDAFMCFRIDTTHEGQRVKTKTSRRVIPVHIAIQPIVKKLVKTVKGDRLFPEVEPDGKGNWSGLISPRFSNLFDQLEMPDGIVFHSTRHAAKTILRDHVSDSVSDRMLGQATPGVGGKYGIVPVKTMAAALEKLSYPGVKFPRLV